MDMRSEENVVAAVEALLGRPVDRAVPAGVGANSRVYRVDVAGRRLAAKAYPVRRSDPRRRAANEWRTLGFLRDNGVTEAPQPIRHDAERGILLMEWVEGEPVDGAAAGDIDAALSFLGRVFALSARPPAETFEPASEACLCGAEIARQIAARRASFVAHPALRAFLEVRFDPLLERALGAAAGPCFAEPLPAPRRRLIPADFGFHNAIRAADGRLRFIDFDYFGWDDPVKLAADFVLHPAMSLTPPQQERFVRGLASCLPDDADFAARLARYRPLYALRWALILLNPFRLDRQSDRPAEPLLARQLGKAGAMCDAAEAALR